MFESYSQTQHSAYIEKRLSFSGWSNIKILIIRDGSHFILNFTYYIILHCTVKMSLFIWLVIEWMTALKTLKSLHASEIKLNVKISSWLLYESMRQVIWALKSDTVSIKLRYRQVFRYESIHVKNLCLICSLTTRLDLNISSQLELI